MTLEECLDKHWVSGFVIQYQLPTSNGREIWVDSGEATSYLEARAILKRLRFAGPLRNWRIVALAQIPIDE